MKFLANGKRNVNAKGNVHASENQMLMEREYGLEWEYEFKSNYRAVIRELKQRRRRRQRERQKSDRFIKQNNNFTRSSPFFVHFFAVVARLQHQSA